MSIRIAMWSGPRNISTAMMRAFENRPDCAVMDEPFYAAYLAETGLDHPMREAVLAAQPRDWREVAEALAADGPAPVIYQKHMTHHMLPAFGLDWAGACVNAFLIRDPAQVLASYVKKRAEVSLDDIGIVRQRELFDRGALTAVSDLKADAAATLALAKAAGKLIGGSTVDLATEFTNLITTQRAYSASARIITTADQMLQELERLPTG